jgi:integrase
MPTGRMALPVIRRIKWTAPKVSSQVDRRTVVNPRQARALLEAVRAQQPSGPRLVASFAVMYYAGLRPEVAVNLGRDNVIMPPESGRRRASSGGAWLTMRTGASCTFAAQLPMRAASGPTTGARAKSGS